MTSVWRRRAIASLLLATGVAALPGTGAALAAPRAEQMDVACAKRSTQALRYVPRASDCRRAVERAVRFTDEKRVVVCARAGGGVHRVANRAACARKPHRPSLTYVLPGEMRHQFCANKRTGRLRSTRHAPYKRERGGGPFKSSCHADERRVFVPLADRAPRAAADAATVDEDHVGSVDVLANDRDPEGEPLRVAAAERGTATGNVVVAAGGAAVAYDPTGRFEALGAGATATDRFTYTATDGRKRSAPAPVTVTVTGVNDRPVVAASAGSAAFAERGGPVTVDPALAVADVDSPQLQGASVAITGGHAPGDALHFADQAGIAGSFDAGTGVLSLSGPAPVDAYRAALRSVAFSAAGADPSTASRSVRFRVDDGALISEAIRSVTVAAVGDAPVVATSVGSAAFTEDSPTVVVDPGVTVTDPDSPQLVGATVRIVASHSPYDVLTFTDQNGIAGTFAGAAGVLTLTGTATVAQYEAALRDVRFGHTSDTPSTASRTVRFQVDDGTALSNTAERAVGVSAADDAPVAVADAATVAEDAAATAIDVLANDTDPDGPPPAIASVTLASHGVVVITGGGTGLDYEPDPGFCGPDSFTYTLADGPTATVAITVTCVDDAPVAVDDAATVSEDDGATTVAVLANDTDADDGPMTIASATDPADGTVDLTGGGPGAHTGLTYQPDAGFCGTDTFTYALNGGDSATVTITVTCVDDPPVAVDDAATVLEDAAATAVAVLANDTDTDGGPKTIASASDPAAGTVVLTGGSPGAHTGLTYQPDANACGTDTFDYTLNGGDSATVTMTVTCINDAPDADAESFTAANRAIGNTTLVVDDPTDGAPSVSTPRKLVAGDVLDGDDDPDGPGPLVVVAETKATADGGEVTIEADGDFTYRPAAGTSCTDHDDSFSYTVSDQHPTDPRTDTGTVTIEIQDCVWYVDDSAPAGGDGRSHAPFDATADVNAGGDPDGSGDTIFLYEGSYGGLLLESTQRLLSQRHGLTVGGETLVPAAGTGATLGSTLDLANDNTIQGVSVQSSTVAALAGANVGTATMNTVTPGTLAATNVPAVNIDTGTLDMEFTSVSSSNSGAAGLALRDTAGTFSAAGGSLVNSNGSNVGLTGGTVNFSYGGTVSDVNGVAIAIADATGGTKDFNGAISGGGRVELTNNTGATIRFDGGLALATGGATAFAASGGGTVAVTGPGNTLSASSSTALNVSGTAIHADDLTFQSIAATTSPASGIALTNTGANGGLIVTGSGVVADSGGIIQGSTGPGIALSNVPGGVSLTRVRIAGGTDDGVRGAGVNGFALTASTVTGNGDAGGEHGLDFSGLTGTVAFTDDTVSASGDRNVAVTNNAGALIATFTGGTYSTGTDGLFFDGTGTGTMTVNVSGSTFATNSDDHVQVTTDASNTVTQRVTIQGTTMTNPVGSPGGNVTLNPGGNATLKTTIANNDIEGAQLEGITIDTPGSRIAPQPVSVDATITGNTIGDPAVPLSGSSTGNGIGVRSNGNATVRALLANNAIHQYLNLTGLHLVNNDGDGTLDVTARSNLISNPATSGPNHGENGILAVTGGGDAAEAAVSCLDIGGAGAFSNTLSTAGADLGSGADQDIRIRQRDLTTVELPGYAGPQYDTAAVAAYLVARNSAGGVPTVGATSSGAGPGYVNGSCSLPQP